MGTVWMPEIEQIDWASFPGPKDFRPDLIAPAIRRLCDLSSGDGAWEATCSVEYAMGNASSGTIYPCAPALVPFVLRVALDGPTWPRFAALDALVDIAGFWPEPGFESFVDGSGRRVELRPAVVDTIFFAMIADRDEWDEVRVCAADILARCERFDEELSAAVRRARESPDPRKLFSSKRGSFGSIRADYIASGRKQW
jgi:hypothetical protein